ncbi:hypothetical protein CDEF62S_00994 [Castellaniella defragrans]
MASRAFRRSSRKPGPLASRPWRSRTWPTCSAGSSSTRLRARRGSSPSPAATYGWRIRPTKTSPFACCCWRRGMTPIWSCANCLRGPGSRTSAWTRRGCGASGCRASAACSFCPAPGRAMWAARWMLTVLKTRGAWRASGRRISPAAISSNCSVPGSKATKPTCRPRCGWPRTAACRSWPRTPSSSSSQATSARMRPGSASPRASCWAIRAACAASPPSSTCPTAPTWRAASRMCHRPSAIR